MSNKKEQLVTLPLEDLIWNILGDNLHGLDKAPVTSTTGLILEQFLKDSLKWKIVFEDVEGNRLKYPILWRYPDWFNSTERYFKAKKWSEQERIKRWIKDKNIDNLAKAISKSSGMKLADAMQTANKLIAKGASIEVLQMLGLDKLVTTEEEL